jgi:hypothetical protein
MVVIDSQMLGRTDKVVNLKTTETAGLTGRHYGLQTEVLELFVIQIVRGDRGIGVAPFEMRLTSVDLPVVWSFFVAETRLPFVSLTMIMSPSFLLVKTRERGVCLTPSTTTSAPDVKTFLTSRSSSPKDISQQREDPLKFPAY